MKLKIIPEIRLQNEITIKGNEITEDSLQEIIKQLQTIDFLHENYLKLENNKIKILNVPQKIRKKPKESPEILIL